MHLVMIMIFFVGSSSWLRLKQTQIPTLENKITINRIWILNINQARVIFNPILA